jgi:hypothetical protein
MLSESEARQPPHLVARMDFQPDKQQHNLDQQQHQQQVSHAQTVSRKFTHNHDYHSHAALGLPMGYPIPQMSMLGPATMGQVSMGSGTMQSQRFNHNRTFGEYPGYDPRMRGGGGQAPLSRMYPESMMVPTTMMPGVLPYGMSHLAHPTAVMVQAQMFHPWAQGAACRYQDRAGFGDPRGHASWSVPPLQGAVSDASASLYRAADILTRSNTHTVRRECRKRGADTCTSTVDASTASRPYSDGDFGSDLACDRPPQSTMRKGSGTHELPMSSCIPTKLRRIESDGHSFPNQSDSRVR